MQKYRESGSIERKSRKGTGRSTSARDDRQILRLKKSNRFQSSAEIRKEFASTYVIDISSNTINRRICLAAFGEKVFINDEHDEN